MIGAMRFSAWPVLAFSASCLACAATGEPFWPDHLYTTGEDGVSNRGQSVPMLYVGNGVPSGEECIDLAPLTRLRTFPEREDVAMTAMAFPPYVMVDAASEADPSPVGSSYGVVQAVPGETLANRWYLVGFVRLPSEVQLWPGHRFYRDGDGFVGVRFRVGSQPAVLSLRRAHYPGKATRVTVTFSEKVIAVAADLPWIEVQSLASPSASVLCSHAAYNQPVDTSDTSCGTIAESDVLLVTIRAFRSADGAQTVDESAHTLDPATLIQSPSGELVLYVEPRAEAKPPREREVTPS